MNQQKAIEIQIYFEIAMAIGNDLDLREMLQQALSAYLRKLGCTSGMILQLYKKENLHHYRYCFSIPRNSTNNPIYSAILEQLPETMSEQEFDSFISSLPLRGIVNEHFHFHISNLPHFGLLLLIRKHNPLDTRTLHSLRQLNRKLARSCNACLQKERMQNMNEQLNQEIDKRLTAEKSLNDLLENLELQVDNRTRDLQSSRQRYKTLFDHIQDIYFSLRLDGTIQEISPSVEQTLHYPRQELLNRPIEIMGFSRQDKEYLFEQLSCSEHIWNYPISIPAIEGDQHHFSMNASIIRTPEQEGLQIVGSLRDITEQHKAQESRRILEEKLLNSKKMEALGLLAGGVAHDLNNVLSGIVSYPDLLLSTLDENSELYKPITTIKESGEKAAAIVQDLLTMARRNVVQKAVININSIVSDYLASPELERLSQTHPGLKVTTNLERDLLNMQGSAFHIKKALMNLVHNAAEADANVLCIITENKYLEEKMNGGRPFSEGDYVVLKVVDNGHGISAEDQKRVFEPFYTKKVMGRSGTGLGMSVVWGTVEDHKGHISIESEPDEQTTIALFFPATRKKEGRREPQMSLQKYHAKGETVLIVDDSEDQRQIAGEILQSMGYQTSLAASGEEALTVARGQRPDLVLLDMIMGSGLDGLDTYRELKTFNPEIKVIIATGYSETDRVKEALHLGAYCYIRKPYLMRTLGQEIRNCLDDRNHKDDSSRQPRGRTSGRGCR